MENDLRGQVVGKGETLSDSSPRLRGLGSRKDRRPTVVDQRGRCLFVNEQDGDPILRAFLKGLVIEWRRRASPPLPVPLLSCPM